MTIKAFVTCLFLMLAANASADQSTKAAKIGRLMQLQGMTGLIQQQQAYVEEEVRAVGPQLIAEFKKQIPEINQTVLDELDAAFKVFVESTKPTWTADEAVADWGKRYGEQVTEAELDQIIAFYSSSVGQKDLAATAQAMPGWSAFLAEKNQKALESAMSAYVERLKAIVENSRVKK
jgi:hypothetical protein